MAADTFITFDGVESESGKREREASRSRRVQQVESL
jgi:hypothetical protein